MPSTEQHTEDRSVGNVAFLAAAQLRVRAQRVRDAVMRGKQDAFYSSAPETRGSHWRVVASKDEWNAALVHGRVRDLIAVERWTYVTLGLPQPGRGRRIDIDAARRLMAWTNPENEVGPGYWDKAHELADQMLAEA